MLIGNAIGIGMRCGGERVVDAASFGFLPAASPLDNVTALNNAVTGGGIINVTTAGIYEIDGTIWIPSNTTLNLSAGITLKKIANVGTPYTHIFANKGILTGTRNSNIILKGTATVIDTNGIDSYVSAVGYRMKGHLNFYRCDDFTVDGFTTVNTDTNQFFIHIADVNNFSFKNISITSSKDAIHMNGLCFDGLFEDIYTDEYDTSIGMMCTDWAQGTPCVGSIERITFRRWTDTTVVQNTLGTKTLINSSSWMAWANGNQYKGGSVVTHNGNIYIKPEGGPGLQTAVTGSEPVHTSGTVTGADGIAWTWMQPGTFTEAFIRNITVEDSDFTAEGDVFYFISKDTDDVNGLEIIYPGTEGNAYIENFILDNIRYDPKNTVLNNSLIYVSNFVKSLVIKNSTITPVDDVIIMNCNRAGTSVDINNLIENITIDNCDITLSALSLLLSKTNLCMIVTSTIINSHIILAGQVLIYSYQASTGDITDITLTNTIVENMLSLTEALHGFNINIVASGCEFINPVNMIYHNTDTGVITFTSTGCTYTNPTGDYLFKAGFAGLTIDVSSSIGTPDPFKVVGEYVVISNCDLTHHTPLYTNAGGSGDRTASITVTTDLVIGAGVISKYVNGTNLDSLYLNGQAVVGKYIRFDFGAGASKFITEATYYQSGISSNGIFKWQGSALGVTWTDIGGNFTLQGSGAGNALTELSVNILGYRYYQIVGVSGNFTDTDWQRQFTFKIDN